MPDPRAELQALLDDLPDAVVQQWIAALQGTSPTQVNLGQAKGFQVMVQGGTAYIGDQIHVDVATLTAVLNQLVAQRQPSGTPNNLPRSGTQTFVGRQEDLDRVHTQLKQESRLAITALKGMGGIGKTELALQYSRHHLDEGTYPGGICWLLAKDQNIGTEIVNFARTCLNVTPPDGLDLDDQVAYVWSQWPTSGDVLVIIDDVAGLNESEAYGAIKPYLPTDSRFRVLLTTRLQLGASIRTVEITILSEAAALELLESLIGQERLDQEPETAKALCRWLGYLPLGLELVGRFLHTKPTWSLAKMQEQLTAKRLEAKPLLRRQADMTAAHESLAAAFELSWQDLKPPAQDLAYRLSLFALAPIPWEWLEEWYDGTDPDDLEDWRDEELISRSLLDLDAAANTAQLHQLIREFFRAKLETEPEADTLKRQYCQHMVAIAQTIPQTPTRAQIVAVTPAIPHLAEAATTWQGWLTAEDGSLVWIFVGLGWFYQGQGDYRQAEPWLQLCLKVIRERLGNTHPHVASSLNNLGLLYKYQGRYSEAEPLYQEALALRKQLFNCSHPCVAISLNNLAGLYESQGQYNEAELLYQEALILRKNLLGDAHPHIAISLNNLAFIYQSQGRYDEAEPLFQETLQLMINLLGDTHPHIAISLNNLAFIYQLQGRYDEAEQLFQNALDLMRILFGSSHLHVATSLNNLAEVYRVQGRCSEAEPLYQESLMLRKQILGEAHPDVAVSLSNLAGLYVSQGRCSEAEPLYQESLKLIKKILGNAHPDVAVSLNNLAGLYASQGQYNEAELLATQALQITISTLGQYHPTTGTRLSNLASLRAAQGNFIEVEVMFLKAFSIFISTVGQEHPYTTETIDCLGNFIAAVVAANQTHLLSNHPTTQALLAQLQP